MKGFRHIRKVLLLTCLTFLVSCTDDCDTPVDPVSAYIGVSIEITEPEEDLCANLGSEITLTAFAQNENGSVNVVWEHWTFWTLPEVISTEPSFTIPLTEEGTNHFRAYALVNGDQPPDGKHVTRLIDVRVDCESPVVVIEAPSSEDAFPLDAEVAFSASVTAGTPPYSYLWSFGEGSGIPDSNQESPTVSFENAGPYTVTLTVTDAEERTHFDTVLINIVDISNILGTDSPLGNTFSIIAVPYGFGGSSTMWSSTISLAYDGAATFNTFTRLFDDIILPGTQFAPGTIATPVGGPDAIISTNYYRLMINYYDGGVSGEFSSGDIVSNDQGKNVQMLNNDPSSDGFLHTHSTGFQFFEFSSEAQEFVPGTVFSLSDFPGMVGTPISAIARDIGGGFLVATESDATAGELWYHDGVPGYAAILIGNLGRGAREIQIEGEICVVPNRLDNTCSVITWSQGDDVSIVGTFPTGSGPRGSDLRLLPSGIIGCAVACLDDDTITTVEIALNGSILSENSIAMPDDGKDPFDIAWVNGEPTVFVVAGTKTDDSGDIVFVIPSGF